WNRRRRGTAHCRDERRSAAALALILPPQRFPREARPAPAAQRAEVIELQHPAGAEDLQALLGEGLVAVGYVVDGADRAINEAEGEARLVRCSSRIAADTARVETAEVGPGEKPQQVDEMARLADDAAAAADRVQAPMRRSERAGVDGHGEDLR